MVFYASALFNNQIVNIIIIHMALNVKWGIYERGLNFFHEIGHNFNILFAFFVCLIMVATIGPPSKEGNVVITNLLDSPDSMKMYMVEPNSIAREAGLQPGDVILKINHIKMRNPNQVVQVVKANALKKVVIKVQRISIVGEKKKYVALNVKLTPNKDGKVGIGLGLARSAEYDKPSKNPFVWIYQALDTLLEWTITMLIGLWLMILNMFGMSPSGSPKIGAEDLHGIIAIVSVFAQAITVDFREIYRWTALISVNLAIVNLLPIPALDGGHLLFMFIEKIRGKRLAESIQQKAIQTGFFLLILLMFFVLFNDIRGLVSGKFNLMKEHEDSVKKD